MPKQNIEQAILAEYDKQSETLLLRFRYSASREHAGMGFIKCCMNVGFNKVIVTYSIANHEITGITYHVDGESVEIKLPRVISGDVSFDGIANAVLRYIAGVTPMPNVYRQIYACYVTNNNPMFV